MLFKSTILKFKKLEKIVMSYLAYESLVSMLTYFVRKNVLFTQVLFILLLGFLFL